MTAWQHIEGLWNEIHPVQDGHNVLGHIPSEARPGEVSVASAVTGFKATVAI